jgi:hypothetical protein
MKIDTALCPSDTPLIHIMILAFLADANDESRDVAELEVELQCDFFRVNHLLRQLFKQRYAATGTRLDNFQRPSIRITQDGHRLLDGMEAV